MRLLIVNAGSSSLKLSALDTGDELLTECEIADWDGNDDAIVGFARDVGAIDTVGHRVVHGGVEFTSAVVIDADVVRRIDRLSDLAPLHQGRAIAALEVARRVLPRATHVACFDTAFHSTMPPAASVYALPAEWRDRWPLRRFGFHGLSHAYAARRTAELAGASVRDLQLVSCHVGAGASLCAVRFGRSVDTTMGFTPLEGLVMATRSGTVDPGLVLWLIETAGLSVQEVLDGLQRRSGLAGLAGTADMREVLRRRAGGDATATLAFDAYIHRLRRELGAMTASLDRVDAVVFTGGVGEHSAEVRAASGLNLDPALNAATTTDCEVTATGASVRTFVVTAREDLEMATQIRTLLRG